MDYHGVAWSVWGALQRTVVLPIDGAPARQWREAVIHFAAGAEERRLVTRAATLGALVVLPPAERAALCARLLRRAGLRIGWLQASAAGSGQVGSARPPADDGREVRLTLVPGRAAAHELPHGDSVGSSAVRRGPPGSPGTGRVRLVATAASATDPDQDGGRSSGAARCAGSPRDIPPVPCDS